MSNYTIVRDEGSERVIVHRPRGLEDFEPSHNFQRRHGQIPLAITFSTEDAEETTFQLGNNRWRPYNPPDAKQQSSHLPAFENVCMTCEDVEIRRLLTTGHGTSHNLGWFSNMAGCRSCTLCRLLVHSFRQAIDSDLSRAISQDQIAFVVLHSLEAVAPLPKHPRDQPYELRALLLDRWQRSQYAETRIRVLSDSALLLRKCPMFHGRLVNASHANLKLASSWLSECCTTHACEARNIDATSKESRTRSNSVLQTLQLNGPPETTEKMTTKNQIDAPESLDTLRVIDVVRDCLTMVPWTARYVALSYAWPRFETLRLLQSNTNMLHRIGALRELRPQLPRVIQDAMTVVLELGETYLWVDALCITQDDDKEKSVLIQSMDQVYGRSLLTLVIATAVPTTENYGIPGINHMARARSQTMGEMEGLQLATALSVYPESIRGSVWATRGWTFQEAILSRRCLIFTDDQMFFRCGRDARSEDFQAEGCKPDIGHAAKPGVRDGQLDYLIGDVFLQNTSTGKAFTEYASLVSGYTGRNFTYPEDILNAFAGIMQVFAPHLPERRLFCFGIPWSLFDQAILWYPSGPLQRIEEVEKNGVKLPVPSWSWARWQGKIGYERTNVELECEYNHPMIEWWLFQGNGLVALRNYRPSTTPEDEAQHKLLQGMCGRMRSGQLVFWGNCLSLLVGDEEGHIQEWLVDGDQTLPCFTLLDGDGDPCGMLPSADRGWAQRHKSRREPRSYEFLLLSYAAPSRQDTIQARARFFHPKFVVLARREDDRLRAVFHNIMLIEYDDDGVAYRRGIGRVHIDVVNKQLDKIVPKVMILG